MAAATAERMGMSFEQFRDIVVKQIPLGRSGKPEDVAHSISFLASEGAGYVTGHFLFVAGGPTA